MKLLNDRCCSVLVLVTALFSSIVYAGIEDIIDETRVSTNNAFVEPYRDYSSSILGQANFSVDEFRRIKSVELSKIEITGGLRIKVKELSSKPVMSGELRKYEKTTLGNGVKYYGLNNAKWTNSWKDVIEDACCYPVAVSAKSLDGVSYSTILRSNPLGYFELNYYGVISALAETKGGAINGEVSLLLSGVGKVPSNEIKIKIPASTVSTIQ